MVTCDHGKRIDQMKYNLRCKFGKISTIFIKTSQQFYVNAFHFYFSDNFVFCYFRWTERKTVMNFNRMPLHPPFHPPSHLPPNAGPPNMPPNPGHMPQGMPPGPMPPPHLPPHIGGAELGRGDGMPMQGHFPNQVN